MNQSLFATRILRRIGFFLPLFLTLLVAADAAYACPQHSGSAGYRTKRIVQRSDYSPMATTVITYRAPISYRRCGNTLTDTRGARYVARSMILCPQQEQTLHIQRRPHVSPAASRRDMKSGVRDETCHREDLCLGRGAETFDRLDQVLWVRLCCVRRVLTNLVLIHLCPLGKSCTLTSSDAAGHP